jgi:hypothetical protein
MTKDMHDWEDKSLVNLSVGLVVCRIDPLEQLKIVVGLENNKVPTATVYDNEQIHEAARALCKTIVSPLPSWAQIRFVCYEDRRPDSLLLLFHTQIPDSFTVTDKVEWLRYDDLVRNIGSIPTGELQLITKAINS